MTVVDSHCHAWRRWPYDTRVPDPLTRGSIEALLYEMDTHDVDHATVVCARIGGGAGGDGFENRDNNDYVSAFARTHADRITAWVDVDSVWRDEYHRPGAAERLEQELDRAEARGFTHYFASENDGWLRSDAGREFFRVAAERGVIASLACGADWFTDLAAIARENPDLPILLHHLTSPRRDRFEADIDAALALAELPSIGVKVSGFNYHSALSWDFPYPESRALFRRLFNAFGAGRLYWGSDFPASRDMLTYTQAIEVLRVHCDFIEEADLTRILGQNLAELLSAASVPAT